MYKSYNPTRQVGVGLFFFLEIIPSIFLVFGLLPEVSKGEAEPRPTFRPSVRHTSKLIEFCENQNNASSKTLSRTSPLPG